MLATMVALALASKGQSNREVPDPTGPMGFDTLTIATLNAGACSNDPEWGAIPAQDASVQLQWRVWNRDDDLYRFDVYLLEPTNPLGSVKLGTNNYTSGLEVNIPTWSQGWLGTKLAYGRLIMLGYVENGPFNSFTTDWKFKVELRRIADNALIDVQYVSWNKTYGTCS